MLIKRHPKLLRLLLIVGLLIILTVLINNSPLKAWFSLDKIVLLRLYVQGFGLLAPLVFVGLYIIAAIFFLPGLPLGIISGVLFGPLLGALCSAVGGTLGATAAFLIARYTARDAVQSWVSQNPQLVKLDQGVAKNGWRMVMFTRLMPIFPYNLQNYAYGLTKISLAVYFSCSLIFMLPANIALSFFGGSLSTGMNSKIFLYLGIAAVFLTAGSFLPKILKSNIEKS